MRGLLLPSSPTASDRLGKDTLGELGVRAAKRHERPEHELRLAKLDPAGLEQEAPEPADGRTLVSSRVLLGQEHRQPERVAETQPAELVRRGEGLEDVAALERALEAAVR